MEAGGGGGGGGKPGTFYYMSDVKGREKLTHKEKVSSLCKAALVNSY